MFAGRLIPRFEDFNWPAHSPDLAVADYFAATSKARYKKQVLPILMTWNSE
jgi:hypothetical protein